MVEVQIICLILVNLMFKRGFCNLLGSARLSANLDWQRTTVQRGPSALCTAVQWCNTLLCTGALVQYTVQRGLLKAFLLPRLSDISHCTPPSPFQPKLRFCLTFFKFIIQSKFSCFVSDHCRFVCCDYIFTLCSFCITLY